MSKIADILSGLEKVRSKGNSFSVDLTKLDHYIAQPDEGAATKLIPVASGKGGVGKTNLSVNMALCFARRLAKEGKSVLLIDCDFGLPDADLILGVEQTNQLENFLRKPGSSLEKLKIPTRYEGLFFLGNSDRTSSILSNMYYSQRKKFIKSIRELACDVVILDLGASVHYEVVDFYSLVDSGIVVVNPEPPSLRDARLFLRSVLLRRSRQWLQHQKIDDSFLGEWEKEMKISKNLAEVMILNVSAAHRSALEMLFKEIKPRLIINRSRSPEDSWENARIFRDQVREELGIEVVYLGCVSDDPAVKEAVVSRTPVIERFPDASASREILSLSKLVWEEKDFNLDRNYYALKSFLRGLFRR